MDYDEWVASLKDTGLFTAEGYKVLVDQEGQEWVSDSDADIFVRAEEYQIIRNTEWPKEGF